MMMPLTGLAMDATITAKSRITMNVAPFLDRSLSVSLPAGTVRGLLRKNVMTETRLTEMVVRLQVLTAKLKNTLNVLGVMIHPLINVNLSLKLLLLILTIAIKSESRLITRCKYLIFSHQIWSLK